MTTSFHFKPIMNKEKMRKIWDWAIQCLNFDREWKNFLEICDNDKNERIFALNNFIITEFLVTNCEIKPSQLNEINCFCDKEKGCFILSKTAIKKYGIKVRKFLRNFNRHQPVLSESF